MIYTYLLHLDRLDGATATFISPDEVITLTIPREHWEFHGRPAQLQFNPEPPPIHPDPLSARVREAFAPLHNQKDH